MANRPTSDPVQARADSETGNSYGVLVSGNIQKIIGDLVGGDKITINIGNPEFEAELISLIRSRDASTVELSALATNLIALRLSTVFVDQMRLLYITTGHRLKQANAHLRAHFIERTESDIEQFNTYMKRYSGAQFDGAFLRNVDVVERRCTWTFTEFASAYPLPRDRRVVFREMANAADPMYEILQAADASAIDNTVAVVDDVATALQQHHAHPVGFAKADEIAVLRFAIQTEALRRLQGNEETRILTIDHDVEGTFSALYFIIDRWLLERCEPWI